MKRYTRTEWNVFELRTIRHTPGLQPRAANSELSRLLRLYVERFNRRDWDGLREVISANARLRVADHFVGAFANAPYFSNYHRWPTPWRLALGNVDGEPAVIIHFLGWQPVDTNFPYSC
jgi:hypothetical protein